MVALKVIEGRKESSNEMSRLLVVEAKAMGVRIEFELLLLVFVAIFGC